MKQLALSIALITSLVCATISSADTNVFPLDGGVGIGTLDPGASKLKIQNASSDYIDFSFASPNMGHLQFIGWTNGWNINSKTNGKNLYINRDAGANSNVFIGRSGGKELFVRGSDGYVGLGTSQPLHPFHLKNNWAVMSLDTNAENQDSGFRLQENGLSRWHIYNNAGSGDTLEIYRDPSNTTGKLKVSSELEVVGRIRATEVVVENTWSDFVFEPEYTLRSLEEVELYIEEKGHLPDVPSAATIRSEGLSVGEAQKIMMQKIEELTLYVIDMNKEVKALRNENSSLKTELSQLRASSN